MHQTLRRFGYPANLLFESEHWAVLLRPEQVTAGCLVLICKEEAEGLPDVSSEAYANLPRVTHDLETTLANTFTFDKINYLLLMMVDRHVHFHVVPRYAIAREVFGVTFRDAGWPKQPEMTEVTALSQEQFKALQELLITHLPSSPVGGRTP